MPSRRNEYEASGIVFQRSGSETKLWTNQKGSESRETIQKRRRVTFLPLILLEHTLKLATK